MCGRSLTLTTWRSVCDDCSVYVAPRSGYKGVSLNEIVSAFSPRTCVLFSQRPQVHHRWLSLTAILVVTVLCSSKVRGQGDAERSVTGPDVRLIVRPPLWQVHVPGRWSQLPFQVTNNRETTFVGLCSISMGGQQSLRFARRVVVPARATITSWQPVLIPSDVAPTVGQQKIQEVEFRAALFETTGAGDQLIGDSNGRLQIQDDVWLARPGPVTGLVDAPPVAPSTDYFQAITPYDSVVTPRVQGNLLHNLVTFRDTLLPGGEESLDGYDHLIIADDSPLQSPSRLDAVRRWLFGGGHLWVMLNQVNPSVLSSILGDTYNATIIDRVGLTHFDLQAGPGRPPIGEQPFDLDYPVELIRMLVEDVDVEITVDGWPAAYSRACGDGRLFVTTLGLDAWVRPRTREDVPPAAGWNWQTAFVPRESLMEWTRPIFEPRARSKLDPKVLEAQARESIGYSIPSRTLVVGILGAFAVALMIAGWWLLRTGEAQRLALIGPAVAISVSLLLMGVGRLHRSMPSMTAISQYVQPIPGTNDVRAFGSTAMLISEPEALELSGTSGGWLMPEMSGQEATTRRLVWSGIDCWTWENVNPPAGVQTASFYSAGHSDSQTFATATYDADGVSGSLHLPEALTPSDAILVTPQGRMAVTLREDRTFHAMSTDVLAPGEFLSASVLSDQQADRLKVLAALLEDQADQQALVSRPMLYFWTPPWDLGVHYPPSEMQTGAALVAMPLAIERPPAGQFVIPSPFLPYREIQGADGKLPQGVYDVRDRQWQELSRPSATTLRFQLPDGLTPLSLNRATLTVRVTGPMKQLVVSGVNKGRHTPIETWSDPAGMLTTSWQDPEYLQLDEAGGLHLHIAIGIEVDSTSVQSQSASPTFFRVETLSLELEATIDDGFILAAAPTKD